MEEILTRVSGTGNEADTRMRQRRSKEEEAWRGEGTCAELGNPCMPHTPAWSSGKGFLKAVNFPVLGRQSQAGLWGLLASPSSRSESSSFTEKEQGGQGSSEVAIVC